MSQKSQQKRPKRPALVQGNRPMRFRRRVHLMRLKWTSHADLEAQIEERIEQLSKLADDQVMAEAYVSHITMAGTDLLVLIEWHQPIYAD